MFFVDRSAVVLKPTQVFLDWLKSTDDNMPDLTVAQLRTNCSVFLVPVFDQPEQAVAYFDERYKQIFVAELASWVSDTSMYPKDLSLENFWKFFELDVHDMVLDLVDAELEASNVMPTAVPMKSE